MFPWPSPEPGPWGWAAPPPAPSPWEALSDLLRRVEATYPVEEALHAWHVQALADPRLAREPALQRFGRESGGALHDKIAAAGLLRRYLAGETSREVENLLRRRLESFLGHQAQAVAAFRALAAQADLARHPAVRGLGRWLRVADQAAREVSERARAILGVTIPPAVDPRLLAEEP